MRQDHGRRFVQAERGCDFFQNDLCRLPEVFDECSHLSSPAALPAWILSQPSWLRVVPVAQPASAWPSATRPPPRCRQVAWVEDFKDLNEWFSGCGSPAALVICHRLVASGFVRSIDFRNASHGVTETRGFECEPLQTFPHSNFPTLPALSSRQCFSSSSPASAHP